MARKEYTDRELLNKYTSIWLPKKVPKHNDERGELTEELIEMIQKDKGYPALICKLKKVCLREEIESDIQSCIIEKQLMEAQAWSEDKWRSLERKDKELNKYYDELAEVGPIEE